MTRQNYRVWAAAALGLCLVGALALLAWLWLDVHTTGYVPIALQSALRADYSADPRNTPLPALNLGIIEQVIADQPTATPAPIEATRRPGPATPTLIPIVVLLQTPVPSVTPILLPGQPSPTPRPTETPQPTPTPSAVIVPSVTPETSATPTTLASPTDTLVAPGTPSRTPVVSVPTATTRPPTATVVIAPTATLPPPPTNTFVPPPTNTRAPTAVPPSNTPVPPPSDTPAPPPTNTPNAYPPPVTVPPATGYP